MAVIESFDDSKTGALVDPTFGAIRASLRPLEYTLKGSKHVGGHYRVALPTGNVTGVAAGGVLLSLRWDNADRVLVLLRAIVQATIAAAFGTAQETSVDLVRAQNFTAANTGGTAATLGDENKLDPSMGNSRVTDLRVADTAALGGGTLEAEARAIAASLLTIGNALGASAKDVLFDATAGQEHPLVILPGQGFQIRNRFAQGATGEVRFNFSLIWAELPRPF